MFKKKHEHVHDEIGDWRKVMCKEVINQIHGEGRGKAGDVSTMQVKRIYT